MADAKFKPNSVSLKELNAHRAAGRRHNAGRPAKQAVPKEKREPEQTPKPRRLRDRNHTPIPGGVRG